MTTEGFVYLMLLKCSFVGELCVFYYLYCSSSLGSAHVLKYGFQNMMNLFIHIPTSVIIITQSASYDIFSTKSKYVSNKYTFLQQMTKIT